MPPTGTNVAVRVKVPIICRYVVAPQRPGWADALLQVNRNKKSLALSFKKKEGAAIIKKLAAVSDVVVENYLPGSLKKYGLDYESLAQVNKNLIYASITGYGQTGPYSDRAGYDVMVEAYASLSELLRQIPSLSATVC